MTFSQVEDRGSFVMYNRFQVAVPTEMIQCENVSTPSHPDGNDCNGNKKHWVNVEWSKERLTQANPVLLFQQGSEQCGHYWPAVAITVFRHPVLSCIAQNTNADTDLFCRVSWFDNDVEPSNWTTRPLNVNGGICFQHSLVQSFLLHKHSVPAMPLMACHSQLTSIEPVDLVICTCASFPCFDPVTCEVPARLKQTTLDWRFIVPPEFVGCGASED